MKASLLNPEIYNKLIDSARTRYKGAQRKLRLLVKCTTPLMKAVAALKELEHSTQDKIPREIKRKLLDASPILHESLRLNDTIRYKKKKKM